jgi:nuclear protein localization family protein 4
MRSLNELGAPDVQPSRLDAGDGGNAHRRLELAKWLSDWHLLSFLGTSGLLSEVTSIPGPFPFFPVSSCLTQIFT